jgi:hypothetical protein
LREEHKLRVFENRVLRRTFESKRDEISVVVAGDCIMRSFMVRTYLLHGAESFLRS